MAALALSDSDDSDTKMLFAAFQGLDQPPDVRVGDETRGRSDSESTAHTDDSREFRDSVASKPRADTHERTSWNMCSYKWPVLLGMWVTALSEARLRARCALFAMCSL